MFGDISKAEKIYIACGYTDMRKSIDGLAGIVQQNFQLNPFQNSLFLFCGRQRDRLKAGRYTRYSAGPWFNDPPYNIKSVLNRDEKKENSYNGRRRLLIS
ncbi:IS66 family insertion sequence element accessory protein TnpB [Paenibacillus periandrae]|uniref:IS66 family insertion sequence element accessory protein TnpB n=1 Tax=Paenibacillus periandrae TaxID=1761741 RepID=UPI003B82C834